MKRASVQARITELLDASLVELSRGEYALAIVSQPRMIFLTIEWSVMHPQTLNSQIGGSSSTRTLIPCDAPPSSLINSTTNPR
jgi:hypothetical protein